MPIAVPADGDFDRSDPWCYVREAGGVAADRL